MMDGADAKRFIARLQVRERDAEEAFGGMGEIVSWRDRRHIATDCFTRQAIEALRPPGQESDYALIELRLLDDSPVIDYFAGVLAVDDRGIWWYDRDGDVDDPHCWRPTLLPWGRIQSVRLHQVS